MSLGLAFWILMLLWFALQILFHVGFVMLAAWVSPALLFVLFALLGWQVFGPPLRR